MEFSALQRRGQVMIFGGKPESGPQGTEKPLAAERHSQTEVQLSHSRRTCWHLQTVRGAR